MPLPVVFAGLPAGDNPVALFDTQFNALAGFVVIPCSATIGGSANQLELEPFADAPVVTAMTDLAPVFSFVAPASSTGNVTANVAGLGEFPVFKNNGTTLVAAGDIVTGGIYEMVFLTALNGGAGGFSIELPSAGGGVAQFYSDLQIDGPPWNGQIGIGVGLPSNALGTGVLAQGLLTPLGCTIGWNWYSTSFVAGSDSYLTTGGAAALCFDGTTLTFETAPSGVAGTPIASFSPQFFVNSSTGLARFLGPLSVNENVPADAAHAQVFASNYVAANHLAFNIYTSPSLIERYWVNGAGGELSMLSDGGLLYQAAPVGVADAPVTLSTLLSLSAGTGILTVSWVRTTPVTVSTLPAPVVAGAGTRAFVTDATSATFGAPVVGGGGNAVPVWTNGTGWFVG